MAGLAAGHAAAGGLRARGARRRAAAAGRLAGGPASGCGRAAGPPPAVYPSPSTSPQVGTLDTPADVMAVFAAAGRGARSRRRPGPAGRSLLVVYADGVGDPGNVGTLLRAAVAFGASAFVGGARAPPTSTAPKTVRAEHGRRLRAAPVPGRAARRRRRASCRRRGRTASRRTAASRCTRPSCGGRPCSWSAPSAPASRAGARRTSRGRSRSRWRPAPAAPSRSLNAGVAGAIALYEFSRRPAGAPTIHRAAPAAAQEG